MRWKGASPLARLHVGRPDHLPEARKMVEEAFVIGATPPAPSPLILDRIV